MTRESLSWAEELGTPEVTYSNVTIVANKNVIRLDVVMDDAQRVEFAQSRGLDRGKKRNCRREGARTSSTATNFILFSPK
jgi:hypothetical protein